MKQITLVLTLLLFSYCTPKQEGPCDYYEYKFKAKVIDIVPYEKNGKQLYDVQMQFDNSSLSKEIQSLQKLKDVEIDSTYIMNNKIIKGFYYRGIVSEIKEGNCTPIFVTFKHNLNR
jgi:hypothetical protein